MGDDDDDDDDDGDDDGYSQPHKLFELSDHTEYRCFACGNRQYNIIIM